MAWDWDKLKKQHQGSDSGMPPWVDEVVQKFRDLKLPGGGWIIILVLALLMITNIEPIYESIIILVFLTYLFVYIMKLLGILEKPFQTEGKTMDDVSLFLLEELMGRLEETASQ